MTSKLEKRSILGLDITPRFWLWDEISRLIEDSARLSKALSNKQDECAKKQARIEQLESQAGIFVNQRNKADAMIRTLEVQIKSLTSDIDAANLRASKASQPRNRGKFAKKIRHEKSPK